MPPTDERKNVDSLADLFEYAARRLDAWRELRRLAEAYVRDPDAEHDAAVRRGLEEIAALESFWAFPGPEILHELRDELADDHIPEFARGVRNISLALSNKSYRHLGAARDVFRATLDLERDEVTAPLDQGVVRPYFEVLLVIPEDVDAAESTIRIEVLLQQLRQLRQSTDDFTYEVVIVHSFEDACVAVVLNPDIQAVVAHEGFRFDSEFGLDDLAPFLSRRLSGTYDDPELGLPLLEQITDLRPELDCYLLVDRDWERVADAEPAAHVRRIFYGIEEILELHLSILEGVRDRFQTPFFDNLKRYAQRPIGTYHALPIARGKSIFKSNWIRDMGEFYGENLFLAESSATTGGLDSLLEPKGNIKRAQELAARAFGADHAFFATNGTSTSNKIVGQALVTPGDIVLIDRNCHKSHHYGCVLSGAQPYYVEAFPLTEYSMYGGVPIRTIKQALLELAAEGQLDRVRMLILTNATFDGHMSDVKRVMAECLAIKPDLVFLWDEAWSAAARFSPLLRRRTAMAGAAHLRAMQVDEGHRRAFDEFRGKGIALDGSDPRALTERLVPDPDLMRVRVYQTTSVHKSMSALRQASIILVADQLFSEVEESFKEAYYTHTSTSPNQQIIASLDISRRQMELEGYELVAWALDMAIDLRAQINGSELISRYFRALTPGEMVPAECALTPTSRTTSGVGLWFQLAAAVDQDEFFLDPTRVTVACGDAGLDGSEFKELLAEKYEIQINKTSRNSVLFQININNTRSDVAHVVKVLADISRSIDERLRTGLEHEREAFRSRVHELVADAPPLPDFSRFHDAFRDDPASTSRHGHMREAFYLAYDADNCEHIPLDGPEIERRLEEGPDLVGGTFVIPYPPGFPVIVPGQIVTRAIVEFLRVLDVHEIHGYDAGRGLKLLRPEVVARVAAERHGS